MPESMSPLTAAIASPWPHDWLGRRHRRRNRLTQARSWFSIVSSVCFPKCVGINSCALRASGHVVKGRGTIPAQPETPLQPKQRAAATKTERKEPAYTHNYSRPECSHENKTTWRSEVRSRCASMSTASCDVNVPMGLYTRSWIPCCAGVQRVLTVINQCFVFKIPPQVSAAGHR